MSGSNARITLGALIIRKKMGFSDRELVKEIARNLYYQYFIGLPGFRSECPFRHGVLPDLCKRFFSVGSRKFGTGLIMARLFETTLDSIALSILVENLFETDFGPLFLFYLADSPDGEGLAT